ncbi:hypothetical protein MMC14_006580 [Varicellaria rhodocarpa]|nr:hypothetical protein [Varicellaria rhodocarpa]
MAPPTFLTLPTEIRLSIYALLIPELPPYPSNRTEMKGNIALPPILLTCRQVYEEAAELHHVKFHAQVVFLADGKVLYTLKPDLLEWWTSWKMLDSLDRSDYSPILKNCTKVAITVQGTSLPGPNFSREQALRPDRGIPLSPSELLILIKQFLKTLYVKRLYVYFTPYTKFVYPTGPIFMDKALLPALKEHLHSVSGLKECIIENCNKPPSTSFVFSRKPM